MKKILMTALILGCFFEVCNSEPVSRKEAEKVAIAWYNHVTGTPDGRIDNVSVRTNDLGVSFYVFQFAESGFVIVAGDDASIPILAYSANNFFPEEIECPSVRVWMDNYSREITEIIRENLSNEITVIKWNNIRNGIFPESGKNVEPLLTTKWSQGCYFNELCPDDPNGPCGHTVTGCMATALAQIMRYHEFPPRGVGIFSYPHPVYGVQTANFGTTDYAWAAMPDFLTSANPDIAEIMYHSGVALSMNYGPNGSGAYIGAISKALIDYFNYKPDLYMLCQQDYSLQMELWKEMIRNDLDQGLPVFYTGESSTIGHAFVCDGYHLSEDTYHFNWGFLMGNHNGFYTLGALNPGSNSFNNNNRVVFNIKPGNPDLVVRINNPNFNEVIKAGASVNIIAQTVRGSADMMMISIDGATVKTGTSNILSFSWNTSTSDLGSHQVIAYSIAGDDTVRYPINLNISDWITQASGFPQTQSMDYISAVDPNVAWAISMGNMGTITQQFAKTINGGDTWTTATIPGCQGLQPSMIFGVSDARAYVTMVLFTGNNPGGIYVTENGGVTWTRQATAAFNNPYSYPNCIHFFNENDGWCMGDPIQSTGKFEMYSTTDGGTNWQPVAANNIPSPVSGEFGICGGYSVIDDTIWFGTNKNRVYRSVDMGYHWEVFNVPSQVGDYLVPVFRNGAHGIVHNFTGQYFYGSNPPKLYETFDGGETWSSVSTTGPMHSASLAYVPGMGDTWVSSSNFLWGETGVSVSYDGGHSWTDFPGTQGAKFGAMSWVNDSCGWAGSYSLNETEWGVYKFSGNILPWLQYIKCDSVAGTDVHLSWGTPINNNLNLNLQGYNVYRNGAKINSNVITATNYLDPDVAPGLHDYCATAVYDEGESNPKCIGVEVLDPVYMEEESETERLQVNLFPNPANTAINIRVTGGKSAIGNIAVFKINSQQLISQPITESQTEIDISHLPAGVYIVKVWNDKKMMVQKVVKQ